MKPTREQVKEFWDKLGRTPEKDYSEPPGYVIRYPPIDLNNLFKYAVPKLGYVFVVDYAEGGWAWSIRGCDGAPDMAEGCHDDPALALFWAIQKVMEVKNED